MSAEHNAEVTRHTTSEGSNRGNPDALPPQLAAAKAQMRAMWMAGDFGAFSQYTEAGDDKIAQRVRVGPGERVLDVACGAGAFALRAAQAGADVTGVDIAPNLIEQARSLAGARGLEIRFDEGDAEALPYEDASFDTVVSQFGAMFAPRPPVVIAEMARVLKSGGRAILFNWTPTGWVGRLFRITAGYVSLPPNAPVPLAWGDENTADERLAPHFCNIRTRRDTYPMQYPFGPSQVLDFFLRNMGPISQSYASLRETEKQQALRADLERFFAETNQGRPDAWQIDSEYLEIEAHKRR